MNGSTSSCEASATRKSTSAVGRPPEQEAVAGERRRHPCGVAGAGSPSGFRPRRRRPRATPDPSATPARISTRPESGVQRDLLVEEDDSVEERHRRQQVRDERGTRRSVAGQQPVEEEERERRAEDAEDDDRPDCLPARHLTGHLERREGEQDHRPHHGRGSRDEHRHRLREVVLHEVVRGSVGERSDDDCERPGNRLPAALRMQAREHRDSGEPHQDPCQADAANPFARVEPEREDDDEDRHGGVRDRRDTGVDVLLAPGDEGEREGRVQEPDRPGLPPRGRAYPRPRRARRRARRAPE